MGYRYLCWVMLLMFAQVILANGHAAAVQFQQPLRVWSIGGKAVVIPPGRYQVNASRNGLRLTGQDGMVTQLPMSRIGEHRERIAAPVARLIAGNGQDETLKLLLPGGRMFESRAVQRVKVDGLALQQPQVANGPSRPFPVGQSQVGQKDGRRVSVPADAPLPSRRALAQRVQALEQQLADLRSVIAVSGGNVVITAPSLTLKAESLRIEAGSSGGLTVTSFGDLRIDAEKDLDARAGAVLDLKAGSSARLTGGAKAEVKGGAKLELDAAVVYVGAGGDAKPVAHAGSMTMTGLGGGVGTVTTGSATVFVK